MAKKRIKDENLVTDQTIVSSFSSEAVDVSNSKTVSIQHVYDVNTPSAFEFLDADVTVADDEITESAHGFSTGVKCQLTTTGTLPGGLATSTDYFVIVIDVDTIKLASSLANALAGTEVTISSAAGGGTHTLTPVSLAGGSVKVQKSNDKVNWIDEDTSNVTADGTDIYEKVDPTYRWIRVTATLTAGRYELDSYILTTGEAL